MDFSRIEAAVEAVIFASGDPIEAERVCEAVGIDADTCEKMVKNISERYADARCGIELVELNGSYQICSKGEFYEEIRTALKLRSNAVLSDVAMETLAIIAYNQPVTRSFVEDVRGVDCSYIIGSLCEKRLIEERGRLDIPGRPLLYGTTDNFLRCFNLTSLEELPKLPRLEGEDPDQMTIEEYTEQLAREDEAAGDAPEESE
ncbi:MAG: SMC-Scp complex subunit ScpB [Clostridia bacterium]|nr:SMC-Scp complex subunit ScpB [Clostridia bacterium]MBR4439214.1 SMC-Scp complex subunit ScpB [Clostridia bacterium]MBR5942116.1 SMC-Scp complex subunit ScpB [Clostridia bacterium]